MLLRMEEVGIRSKDSMARELICTGQVEAKYRRRCKMCDSAFCSLYACLQRDQSV